jgi:hypothetical protein
LDDKKYMLFPKTWLFQEVVSPYGLGIDRLDVREGKAREQSRCSLVSRGDHVILCRLSLERHDDTNTLTALTEYKNLANVWNFELGTKNWPVFTKLSMRGQLAEPGGGGGGKQPPRLDWKVNRVSAGELTDKKTFVQRYSMPLIEDFRGGGGDLHFSSTGQLASVTFEVEDGSSETGRKRLKLAVSLLLSTGVLGFGLTSWEEGLCSLFIPLMNIPLLEEDEEKKWKRVTKHPFLTSLARYGNILFVFLSVGCC